jgi:4-diphosphocytidyl-2-C-methyl-D-erythritol kinase
VAVLTETARAKINLTLRVLGRRPDAYHELESLVVFAATGDRLTLDPEAPDGFTMSGPSAAAIEGINLVERVLSELRAMASGLAYGHFHLEKHLPVAAGIGGGSADAAAAIRLLQKRYPGHAAVAALAAQAERLGADIPACLVSRALVMSGRGERLRPLQTFEPLAAVIVNPRLPLATADVFRALASGPVAADLAPHGWPGGLSAHETIALICDRPNDLEPVARRLLPDISVVLDDVTRLPGCRLSRMSGSGPTCFGLFEDQDTAARAAADLTRRRPEWWVRPATLA